MKFHNFTFEIAENNRKIFIADLLPCRNCHLIKLSEAIKFAEFMKIKVDADGFVDFCRIAHTVSWEIKGICLKGFSSGSFFRDKI